MTTMTVHQLEKQEYWGVAPKFTFVKMYSFHLITSLLGVVRDQSILWVTGSWDCTFALSKPTGGPA